MTKKYIPKIIQKNSGKLYINNGGKRDLKKKVIYTNVPSSKKLLNYVDEDGEYIYTKYIPKDKLPKDVEINKNIKDLESSIESESQKISREKRTKKKEEKNTLYQAYLKKSEEEDLQQKKLQEKKAIEELQKKEINKKVKNSETFTSLYSEKSQKEKMDEKVKANEILTSLYRKKIQKEKIIGEVKANDSLSTLYLKKNLGIENIKGYEIKDIPIIPKEIPQIIYEYDYKKGNYVPFIFTNPKDFIPEKFFRFESKGAKKYGKVTIPGTINGVATNAIYDIQKERNIRKKKGGVFII